MSDTLQFNHDIYLILARAGHGARYWTTSSDPDATIPPAEQLAVLGPATVGADGYDDELSAADMLAELAGIDLEDPDTWERAMGDRR